MALLLPILILLIFGGLEFALLFYNQQILTNASREGARLGIVYEYNPDNPGDNRASDQEVADVVEEYTSNRMVTFGAQNTPQTTVVREGPAFQEDLTVRVTYDYEFLYLANLGFGPRQLVAETVMKNE
jgi:Flp pilus assembly protein TadG